jgi:hypothetical protein
MIFIADLSETLGVSASAPLGGALPGAWPLFGLGPSLYKHQLVDVDEAFCAVNSSSISFR